ncbi:unnamed protein product [Caenorhabditis auriculariae]|uniref:Ubiquitin carboxyl-terminal hydrolase 36 n=1 Tax=Caenorhabditis auriculariae TaxID=2777116 RepID=A0A8S1HLD5_9PELO|nr:unnamed protein product [Caenorhabditis auriculariae]
MLALQTNKFNGGWPWTTADSFRHGKSHKKHHDRDRFNGSSSFSLNFSRFGQSAKKKFRDSYQDYSFKKKKYKVQNWHPNNGSSRGSDRDRPWSSNYELKRPIQEPSRALTGSCNGRREESQPIRNNSSSSADWLNIGNTLTGLNMSYKTDLNFADTSKKIVPPSGNCFPFFAATAAVGPPEKTEKSAQRRRRLMSERGDEMLQRYVVQSNVLFSWANPRLLPVAKGADNLSNNCFAIAALQMLVRVPALVSLLQRHSHGRERQPHNCFVCALLVNFLQANGRRSINWFRKLLHGKWPELAQRRQEDAVDAIMKSLEKIEDTLKTSSPKIAGSAVHDVFGFAIRNEVRCGSCDKVSAHYETEEVLRVRLDPKDTRRTSLEDLVKNYFGPSPMVGYRCSECKKISNTTVTRPKLLRAPQVLIIQLLRFTYTFCGGRKISTPVVPSPRLSLGRFSMFEEDAKYAFESMVLHYGSGLEHGHYANLSKSHLNPGFFDGLDDESVYKVSPTKFPDCTEGYLFLYRRIEHVAADSKRQ